MRRGHGYLDYLDSMMAYGGMLAIMAGGVSETLGIRFQLFGLGMLVFTVARLIEAVRLEIVKSGKP